MPPETLEAAPDLLGGATLIASLRSLNVVRRVGRVARGVGPIIESHGPKVLHAAMTNEVYRDEWLHLLATFALASGWMTLAGWLFRKRGWQ